jgi:enoyl-[acyl-carrier protein] reductase II
MTSKIHEEGVMEMTALMNIKDLYFGGDMEAAPALSGQSVGLIDSVKSVETIIKETISEFNTTCLKLSKETFDE